ncbi:MAG: hypothetical protein HQ593_05310 [Candidatus Omnitrophica bacterium]|nr:hypothetical protein [Candidatus Omnitrophota bacterium]
MSEKGMKGDKKKDEWKKPEAKEENIKRTVLSCGFGPDEPGDCEGNEFTT